MKARFGINLAGASLLFLHICTSLHGQGSKDELFYSGNSTNWLVEIPLWIPGFRGNLAYGDYTFDSSGSAEEKERERFGKNVGIKFYFVGRITARHRKLWMQADVFSGKVGSLFTLKTQGSNTSREFVTITIQGTLSSLAMGYSVLSHTPETDFRWEVIPYLGLRHFGIPLKSSIFDGSNSFQVRPNWLEPVAGLYMPLSYKRFKVELQTDYGAVQSRNSWAISNRYRYRMTKRVDLQAGWNFVRIQYEGTHAGDQLNMRIRLFGPTAGIGFMF